MKNTSAYRSQYHYEGLVLDVPSDKDMSKTYTVSYGGSIHRHKIHERDWACTCPDFQFRCVISEIGSESRYCKHILRVKPTYEPIIFWQGEPVYLVGQGGLFDAYAEFANVMLSDVAIAGSDRQRILDSFTKLFAGVRAHVPFDVTGGISVLAFRPDQYEAQKRSLKTID